MILNWTENQGFWAQAEEFIHVFDVNEAVEAVEVVEVMFFPWRRGGSVTDYGGTGKKGIVGRQQGVCRGVEVWGARHLLSEMNRKVRNWLRTTRSISVANYDFIFIKEMDIIRNPSKKI